MGPHEDEGFAMAGKKLRLVRCKCNYELRYGASTCPYCFDRTPLRNRFWFPLIPIAIGVVVFALVAMPA